MSGLASPVSIRRKSPYLIAFLSGTTQASSPLSKLRGHEHVLRTIWNIACEEWLDLHIDRFTASSFLGKIPELLPHAYVYERGVNYPSARQEISGCPIAVVGKDLIFPSVATVPMGSFVNQESEYLYVNMMPFVISDITSLPEICKPYWPLIQQCRGRNTKNSSEIAYLTIDERSVVPGASQRRSGLHVESPGIMPLFEGSSPNPADAEYSIAAPNGAFIAGAEHHWGGGMMMRQEQVIGGIFMASNVANTTAVWNCRINDEQGEFIGAHGDIEPLRELLGPCARTLEAGELIWMTDRTPHESLPVPPNSRHRQYFRLVTGEVSAWFADHSTPNPRGCVPPPSVRIVRGDKFSLYSKPQRSWHCGSPDQIKAAIQFREVQELFYEHSLGHISAQAYKYGITCVQSMLKKFKKDSNWGVKSGDYSRAMFDDYAAHYYEIKILNELCVDLLNGNIEYNKDTGSKNSLVEFMRKMVVG